MKITKDEFNTLILKSIYTSEHIIPGTVYFDDDYVYGLKRYLGKDHLERLSSEFKDLGKGRIKICSIASSARLCALYFSNGNISHPRPLGEFEKRYPIKNVLGIPPHIDYYSHDTNTCYECKCQEIFDNHNNDKLKVKYFTFIKEIIGHDVKKDDEFLYLTLADLGIKEDNPILKQLDLTVDTSIYDLHFNVKQLFTHTMGQLSDTTSPNHKLQYIFFTPRQDDKKVQDLYHIIKLEIALLKETNLILYASKHNVIFLEPQFVDIRNVYDYALAYAKDKKDYIYDKNFDRIFFSYVTKDYIPSVFEIMITFNDYKINEALAFRVQYNLLLIKARDFDYHLGFETYLRSIKPNENLFASNVRLVDICDEFQISEQIGKRIYEKFLLIREEKEADEMFKK